jgi:hypothetical protein
VAKSLCVHWTTVVRPWLKPLLGSVLMALIVILLGRIWLAPPALELVALAVLGLLAYAGFVGATERPLLRELQTWLASVVRPEPGVDSAPL